jgi:hypothetical protein
MLLDLNQHLARDPATDRALITHRGQAHFGGTGPKGKTCRECVHWCTFPGTRPDYYGAQKGREIKDQSCREFKRLTQRVGPAVPPDAPACKFFTLTESPPPIFEKRHR